MHNRICLTVLAVVLSFTTLTNAQQLKWAKDGSSYYQAEGGDIVKYSLPQNNRTIVVAKESLELPGQARSMGIRNFIFSADERQLLIYTNTKKVCRLDTR